MKKIISLIASVAMLATMVSSVFAADIANNAPVVESTVVEVSAEEYAGMMGASLGEGQKAYMITVNASGFDLENKPGTGFGGASKRTGLLLTTIDYRLKFEDESKLVSAVAMDDGLASAKPGEVVAAVTYTTVPTMLPVIANTDTEGKTVVPSDSLYINTFLVVIKGEVNADLAAEFVVCPYTNSSAGEQTVFRNDNNNISYTVNGESATSITFGAVTPDPDPDPLPDITVANKMTLPSGLSWDVTINNYAPTKTYTATFTATGEADKVHDLNFSAVAEATEGASFGFAALLKLKTEKTNVELAVTKN